VRPHARHIQLKDGQLMSHSCATPEGFHRHPNGGGIVADTATVAYTVYVGPNAQVLDNAWLSDTASVSGNAVVCGNASINRGHIRTGMHDADKASH
jgi:UDP-3-O-[3-hydroxymyristoyl] glucosamine N-acyltransferase